MKTMTQLPVASFEFPKPRGLRLKKRWKYFSRKHPVMHGLTMALSGATCGAIVFISTLNFFAPDILKRTIEFYLG